MEKIDLKDRKILYHLDLNSRQPFSQIGKKTGLNKGVVATKVKRLQELGVIRNFYTVIDVYKLGFIMMRFLYKYQYTTPEKEKEIIDYFVKNKNSTLVASIKGMYNLKVIKIIKDINDFYNVWQDTQKQYGNYFQDKSSALFINEVYYAPSYLLLDSYDKKRREKFTLVGRGKQIEIDDMGFKILNLISSNARIKISDIAEKLHANANTIKDKLQQLKQLDIIQGFRVDIDILKLGYHIFRVNIYLEDYHLRNKIIEYVKFNPNLAFIDTYSGGADIELEFHLENMNQLYPIMQDIAEKFPKAIRNYKQLNIEKYHKFLYLP